jgi:hypothetical protein
MGAMSLTQSSVFDGRVSFDTFPGRASTERNISAFTLNVKHRAYRYEKSSRTFMVGIDSNEYSKNALKWLIDELVDDGDEIVCLRVFNKEISGRMVAGDKQQYKTEAYGLMNWIAEEVPEDKALSIVVEFAVGKLHSTFIQMVRSNSPWYPFSAKCF